MMLHNVTAEIDQLKQKRKLEEVFTKLTNCTSWDEAKMLYPVHAENLDEFLGKLNFITLHRIFFFKNKVMSQKVHLILNKIIFRPTEFENNY